MKKNSCQNKNNCPVRECNKCKFRKIDRFDFLTFLHLEANAQSFSGPRNSPEQRNRRAACPRAMLLFNGEQDLRGTLFCARFVERFGKGAGLPVSPVGRTNKIPGNGKEEYITAAMTNNVQPGIADGGLVLFGSTMKATTIRPCRVHPGAFIQRVPFPIYPLIKHVATTLKNPFPRDRMCRHVAIGKNTDHTVTGHLCNRHIVKSRTGF